VASKAADVLMSTVEVCQMLGDATRSPRLPDEDRGVRPTIDLTPRSTVMRSNLSSCHDLAASHDRSHDDC